MTITIPAAPVADHGPGCQCLRCLGDAFKAANAKVTACTTRYRDTRTAGTDPEIIARARMQWTEARQELALAEHALCTAEDGARLEGRRNAEVDALHWNPGAS
jgi:hypothetical protein